MTLPLVGEHRRDLGVRFDDELLRRVGAIDRDALVRTGAHVRDEAGLDVRVLLQRLYDVAEDVERPRGALRDVRIRLDVEDHLAGAVLGVDARTPDVAEREVLGRDRAVAQVVVVVARHDDGEPDLLEQTILVVGQVCARHAQVKREQVRVVAGEQVRADVFVLYIDRAVLRFWRRNTQLLFRAIGRAQPVGCAVVEGGELGVPGVHLRDLLLGLEPVELVLRDEVHVLARGLG